MRKLIAALAFLLAGSPALAADGAQFDALGFSPDSRYFGFAQWGIQDGSGFPYWQIFVIDLEKDSFIAGTPVKVMIEDDGATLAQARAKAEEQAASALKSATLSVPAELLAANPTTEKQPNRNKVTFGRYYPSFAVLPTDPANSYLPLHQLSLEARGLPRADCPEEDGPYQGFELTLTDMKLGQAHAIHTDKDIPASRGCPLSYAITAVLGPSGSPDTDRLVALISVFTRGFEGVDERFLAIPFSISD